MSAYKWQRAVWRAKERQNAINSKTENTNFGTSYLIAGAPAPLFSFAGLVGGTGIPAPKSAKEGEWAARSARTAKKSDKVSQTLALKRDTFSDFLKVQQVDDCGQNLLKIAFL